MKLQSIETLKTKRNALLKQLAEVGPFVQGSFSKRNIKCGNPNCRCANGQPHEAHVLTNKVCGKTKTTHVPRDLKEEVRQWASEYKKVKKLMSEISKISDQIIRLHVKTNRAAAQNKKRAQQTLQKSSKTSSNTSSPSS